MPSLNPIDIEPPVYTALYQDDISEVIWREVTAGEIGIFPEDAHSTFRGIPDSFEKFLSPIYIISKYISDMFPSLLAVLQYVH